MTLALHTGVKGHQQGQRLPAESHDTQTSLVALPTFVEVVLQTAPPLVHLHVGEREQTLARQLGEDEVTELSLQLRWGRGRGGIGGGAGGSQENPFSITAKK